MTRRQLIVSAAAAAGAQSSSRFIKSICSVAFPPEMPLPEVFRRAKNAGFGAVEIQMNQQLTPATPAAELPQIRDAARRNGLTIAAIWPSGYTRSNPLNSPDPAVRARGVDVVKKALEFATALECDSLLIVPGRVSLDKDEKVARAGYQETWDRTTAALKQLVPFAERAKVTLAVENVVNKFLLSPAEMRSYLDQFHSPWVRSHFDVGNTMLFGYPQDWIEILGPRIRRVHLKDFKHDKHYGGTFVPLTEGDVNWREVMAAFVKTGYRGPLSHETAHDPKDPDQLIKISRAMDKILELA